MKRTHFANFSSIENEVKIRGINTKIWKRNDSGQWRRERKLYDLSRVDSALKRSRRSWKINDTKGNYQIVDQFVKCVHRSKWMCDRADDCFRTIYYFQIFLKRNKSHRQFLLICVVVENSKKPISSCTNRHTHTHKRTCGCCGSGGVREKIRENLLQSIENICKNRKKNEKKIGTNKRSTIYICTMQTHTRTHQWRGCLLKSIERLMLIWARKSQPIWSLLSLSVFIFLILSLFYLHRAIHHP